MRKGPDLSSVTPSWQMQGEDPARTTELRELLLEASDYLKGFKWCRGIVKSYLGIGIGKVLGVFLFKIDPARSDVDEWVWVVVGDLPSAYIASDLAINPACALDAYVGAMLEWVDAANAGKDTKGLIPVNAAPTSENVKELKMRLDFLRDHVLIQYSGDLKHGKQ